MNIELVSARIFREARASEILVESSCAALSVNVASMMLDGLTRFFWIRNTARWMSVYVFPVPGPAMMSRGPLVDVMASF